jgi:lysophospholipase L1-like esterase
MLAAKDSGIQIVDGPNIYKSLKKEYHEGDGIHFNNYGYEVFINEVAKHLL